MEDEENVPSEVKSLAVELQRKRLAVSMRDAIQFAYRVLGKEKKEPVRKVPERKIPGTEKTALDASFEKNLRDNPDLEFDNKPLKELLREEKAKKNIGN